MDLRLRPDWISLGQITVTPNDDEVIVPNPLTLGLDHNTILLGTKGPVLECPWPFSFGLLSFRTDEGYLFGTAKVYAKPTFEVYSLTSGLPPVERTGRFIYRPRSFNLSWVSQDPIPSLTLDFYAVSYNDRVVETLGGGTASTYVTPSGERFRFKNVTGDQVILQRQ